MVRKEYKINCFYVYFLMFLALFFSKLNLVKVLIFFIRKISHNRHTSVTAKSQLNATICTCAKTAEFVDRVQQHTQHVS